MEARIVVLEHIAADTKETSKEIGDVLVRLEANHRSDLKQLDERQRSCWRQLAEHQRNDFRLLLSGGAAATMALAALMAHGFHWL